jgi:hypothetical protein
VSNTRSAPNPCARSQLVADPLATRNRMYVSAGGIRAIAPVPIGSSKPRTRRIAVARRADHSWAWRYHGYRCQDSAHLQGAMNSGYEPNTTSFSESFPPDLSPALPLFPPGSWPPADRPRATPAPAASISGSARPAPVDPYLAPGSRCLRDSPARAKGSDRWPRSTAVADRAARRQPTAARAPEQRVLSELVLSSQGIVDFAARPPDELSCEPLAQQPVPACSPDTGPSASRCSSRNQVAAQKSQGRAAQAVLSPVAGWMRRELPATAPRLASCCTMAAPRATALLLGDASGTSVNERSVKKRSWLN